MKDSLVDLLLLAPNGRATLVPVVDEFNGIDWAN